MTEIVIDGTIYVKKEEQIEAETPKQYVLIRSNYAGVFFGIIKKSDTHDEYVVLNECRRLWHWEGAATLSEMSVNGVGKPDGCKFTGITFNHEIKQVCEIIQCTKKAVDSIKGVQLWEENKD